ncbi:MAG: bacterioferritin [Alistipes sp.]|nr:bacterioferritin [Alistipes sp.]
MEQLLERTKSESGGRYGRSIDRLNAALGAEISSTLQYIYLHTIFEDAGYEHLASIMRSISIQEMHHIEEIAERILFLEGEVNMNPSFATRRIKDVREAFEFAAKLEQSTIDSYNEYARMCAEENDAVSQTLFQEMSAEEERHLDIFRTEVQNIVDYGSQYLMMQSAAHSKNVAKKNKSHE